QRDEILFTRHRDTCGWLTADKRYKNWARNDGKTVLWIRGDPGCGKSVLAAFLSAHLAIENAAETFGKQYVVAYFFCNDKDERLRTPHAILASLLAQILWQEQDSFVHFSTESQYVMHRGLTVWDFPMLLRVLGRILKDDHIRPLCLLIDALGM
ncbi:hypothetical protein BZA05DRAFT_340680, partial [Tricharina praecox]|uniref:uncharacterized protein n=1 Tax=Tricharina praecox TaxID=43433 RepID=UPI002220A8AB